MADKHLTKAERKALRKAERSQWEEQMDKQQKNSQMKKAGFWVGGILVTLAAIYGLYLLVTAAGPSQASLAATMPALTANEMSRGPQNAKATLVEYADFQCPACYAYYPLMKQLYQDYANKVRFVYRFFPLTAIHKNAMASAEAGYAASLQGKFWEMEDLLFTNQHTWESMNDADAEATFVKYAQQLGLDTTKFSTDMHAKSTADFIQAQEDAGTNAGVNATPTFFLNGKQMQNPNSLDEFKQDLNTALK